MLHMSSLEMLTLLELAQGRPASLARAEAQSSPVLSFVRQALRWLGALGHRSLLLVALLSLWETAPRLGLIDAVFLPSFSEVIAAGWQLAQAGQLYDDVAASLLRALSGFLIAVVLIVPLGLAIGWYARLGNLLINSQYSFLIPQMYFGILGITVIGLTFNAILQALEQRFMRWKATA